MHKSAPVPASAVTTAAAVLAAGLALAGCGSSASSSGTTATGATGRPSTGATSAAGSATAAPSTVAASGSVPFPVAVGNTWTYKITGTGDGSTTVNTMTAVKPVAGGQQVTMTTTDQLLGKAATSRETYLFGSDGSITYPLSQLGTAAGVTVTGTGVVWPPASVIDSGSPSKSALKLSIKAAGQAFSTTAHLTVQGAGTATVTVPAGTYQATVVRMTEAISVEGIALTEEIKVWLAPGVGPVKDQVLTDEAGASHVTVTEELESFKKG
jgi:uncharacterized protein DUF3108